MVLYRKPNFLSIAIAIVFFFLLIPTLTGCSEAELVSHNVSQEADNFNVMRKITVLNMRTDTPIFEMTGRFSIQNNLENELEVIVESEDGVYKKHFIYLNEYTIYVIEDISGADVEKYHYTVSILPETLFQPFDYQEVK